MSRPVFTFTTSSLFVGALLIGTFSACSKESGGDLKATPEQEANAATTAEGSEVEAKPAEPSRTMEAVPAAAEVKAPEGTLVKEMPPVTGGHEMKTPPTLEEAIAAPGPKKITAVSADGRTKVIKMGQVSLAETETYSLKATIPSNVTVGKEAVVAIKLTPKTGWHINKEFPTKLKITAPAGVKLAASTLSAKEAAKFTDDLAVFNVKINASAAGAKSFTGKFRFAMCTDSTCDPKSADIAFTLVAK